MGKIGIAYRVAAEVHEGDTDKADIDYIEHPVEVARIAEKLYGRLHRFREDDGRELVICTALLHDTVEDFQGTEFEKRRFKDFLYQTFGDRIWSAIDVLTRQIIIPDTGQKEDYLGEYIPRIERNWIARLVKIADLTHNMDPTRLPQGEIVEYDFERWDKYRRALVRLEEVDGRANSG